MQLHNNIFVMPKRHLNYFYNNTRQYTAVVINKHLYIHIFITYFNYFYNCDRMFPATIILAVMCDSL